MAGINFIKLEEVRGADMDAGVILAGGRNPYPNGVIKRR
jgi:hypothetical protein